MGFSALSSRPGRGTVLETNSRIYEHIVPAHLFRDPPAVGQYYASGRANAAFLVGKVRRVGGDTKPCYCLIGPRLPRAAVPTDAEIIPWPRTQTRAAQPPAATDRPKRPITTRAAMAQAERKRIVALRRAHNDPNSQAVEAVRVASGSVVSSEWRDPDDNNPNRRIAKVVRGYRATDQVDMLMDRGTLNRSQASAARRFRKLYELGEIGLKSSPNLLEARIGFEAGSGPSEVRLMWLQQYQAVCNALRPSNVAVLLEIIIQGVSLKDYAARRRVGPSVASGMLMSAVQFLSDFFKELDDGKRDKAKGDV